MRPRPCNRRPGANNRGATLKTLILTLLVLLAPLGAQAACVGRNLLDSLSAPERQSIDAAVAAQPFPSGNHWRATRGDSVIDVFGTFHLYDPRMEDVMKRIAPFFETADAVYLEATTTEIERLQAETSRDPTLIFIPNGTPTLPERLPEADWQALKAELTARGLPPFIASKFRAWYVMILLGMPPCAMPDLATASNGLDKLIETRARAAGVDVRPLEAYDTLFRIFGALTPEDEIGLLRATLATTHLSEDMFFTLGDTYFSGDHRLIWELSAHLMQQVPGMSDAAAQEDIAVMEDLLLTRRNRAWLDVILPAAEGRRIAVAVGAAHLSGHAGVLNLLAEAGFTLEPAPF
ncbi:MAG: hypothetical protein RLZZ528_179 [Pseudomonadota bacterium]